MRRWLCWLALALTVFGQTGCVLTRYSSNPQDRMGELLVESENLRQIQGENRRFWLLSSPSTLTYERVSGAMEP
jgi:hypothetical protein